MNIYIKKISNVLYKFYKIILIYFKYKLYYF